MNEPTFQKRVLLTLPPCDSGPICSYSPICSPTDRSLSAWRTATITMTETALSVEPDEERVLIGKWLVQLVQRELGGALTEAESLEKTSLRIPVDDLSAQVIRTALAIRCKKAGLTA